MICGSLKSVPSIQESRDDMLFIVYSVPHYFLPFLLLVVDQWYFIYTKQGQPSAECTWMASLDTEKNAANAWTEETIKRSNPTERPSFHPQCHFLCRGTHDHCKPNGLAIEPNFPWRRFISRDCTVLGSAPPFVVLSKGDTDIRFANRIEIPSNRSTVFRLHSSTQPRNVSWMLVSLTAPRWLTQRTATNHSLLLAPIVIGKPTM